MAGPEGDDTKNSAALLARLAGEAYCYLTTSGRVSGRPHTIEIWFGAHERTIYMLSGGGERSDWVKNLRANPAVTVRIGGQTFAGAARVVSDAQEDALARRLLADKYGEYEDEGQPTEWARTALPVAVDLAPPRV
jgi:deazaflavin-dependent oxidoreductase (nitroreductase family)